jgi:UDP-N-acetylmuramate dehydrogenase
MLEVAASLLSGVARSDEPIGPKTTYRVGGRAALFAEIDSEHALARVCDAVAHSGIAVLVLGRGSNLLVAESGFPGLCVTLAGSFAACRIEAGERLVVAGGGCDFPVLARRSAAAGLAGMEWAVGIPGSVGGAVRMNAGGHGADTSERLVDCRVVDLRSGADGRRPAAQLAFGYRRSALGAGELVCDAAFRCAPGNPERSAALISEIVAWRRAHQPGGRNAGSIFANPPGDSAGRLIEEAGLKGLRMGSAEVSHKHANFVQADPGGSADDVHRLVRTVQQVVAERCGVELELELRLVGDFS